MLIMPIWFIGPARGQADVPITGDRLSGFVLPIEPLVSDITLSALSADAWTVDDTKRLALRGDVRIAVGSYVFHAEEAAVWINRLPSADGVINQMAIFFDKTSDPARRPGTGARGRNLLVTGSARGDVIVDVAQFRREPAADRSIVKRGRARLRDYLRRIAGGDVMLRDRPDILSDAPPEPFVPVPGNAVRAEDIELPTTIRLPEPDTRAPWLRDPEATIQFTAGRIEYQQGDGEDIILATGSLRMLYRAAAPDGEFGELTLDAERAVIFLQPDSAAAATSNELTADRVRGIYLEGNVIVTALRKDYVVRAPRMYYDLETGQAIMVDAILRTHMRGGRVPVHARAREMRQISEDQWAAADIRVSTSEFFTPHLSLGADRMTLTQRPSASAPEEDELHLRSDGNTFRVGDFPVFGWPTFSGTLRRSPFRGVTFGVRDNSGLEIKAKWDLFGLLGVDTPDTIDAELAIDGYTARGAGAGVTSRYNSTALGRGTLEVYGMYDTGIDRTDAGREVDPDQDFRGLALWEHEQQLSRNARVQLQGSYISDETFIPQWRDEDYYERREYESSI